MRFCVERIQSTLLPDYSHYIQLIIPGVVLQVLKNSACLHLIISIIKSPQNLTSKGQKELGKTKEQKSQARFLPLQSFQPHKHDTDNLQRDEIPSTSLVLQSQCGQKITRCHWQRQDTTDQLFPSKQRHPHSSSQCHNH